ncbi:hypothetical protein BDV93DRAFT_611377 [Ceratobasidium sp. AG-I]|nr:hypothetical protein BDV93DRAFT_611377 [Ceratobasidium sp. AG-I]
MSYNNDNEYGSSGNEFRRNQEFSNEYGSRERNYDRNESDERGLHTEAGHNAQGHFNAAAEGVGRAAAEFDSGGGRQAVESVGNPIANRNENSGEHVNPFLKPAQELAEATIEGAKGLPGALFEFATGQYEAHKVHPEGNRSGHTQQENRRNEY